MIGKDTILRTAGILAAFLVLYLLFVPFAPQLRVAGDLLAQQIGLPGVFLFVILVDTFIVPLTPDVIMPLLIEWPLVPVILTIGLASVLGGICGYAIGRSLGHLGIVQRAVQPYREQGEKRIRRGGFWAVFLAALTPIPFSTVSWLAGMLKVPFGLYAAAALFRIPRLALTLLLFRSGWKLLEQI